MVIRHSHVVLDACCLLNFAASGHLLDIIKAIPAQAVVTEIVATQELKTLNRLQDEKNEAAIQFEAAISQGLLMVVDFNSDREAETFINYAAVLGDDGDAATCAIAISRDYAIATDDKREISFFQKEANHLQVLSTLELVKYWSETAKVDDLELEFVLTAIRVKGKYMPNSRHPLLSWWQSFVKID
jgi:hypothetical protein